MGSQRSIGRVAQESLSNVARHARAQCASLRLRVEDHAITLVIEDNGASFSLGGIDEHRCFGLRGGRDPA
jgi:signal transduction histidine kinase